jgi:hypothetical protein
MHRVKSIIGLVLALAVVAGMIGALGWTVFAFFRYLTAIPKELGAALVAGAATILVATITVMVGRYYERKKELDALYRDKKTEIYDEFLKEFLSLFWGAGEGESHNAERDLVPYLREFTRKLILWSGPEVIEAFIAWKNHLSKGVPDAQSIFLAEAFLKSIRTDLRNSNNGLRKGFFARLWLKEGELFLAMAAKNPNLTLAALAEAEAALKSGAPKWKDG